MFDPPTLRHAEMIAAVFAGRSDVYAVQFRSPRLKRGVGYIPVRDRSGRYVPVSVDVYLQHLSGARVVGVYPLLPGWTCRFITADVDGHDAQSAKVALPKAEAGYTACVAIVARGDARAAALERSRSGAGYHVWLFFGEPVAARHARDLMKGAFGLPLTGAVPEETGVELYPSQDELPAGSRGVGNLIALPWQKGPREEGNSVLLSLNGRPVQSQEQALEDLYRAVTGA